MIVVFIPSILTCQVDGMPLLVDPASFPAPGWLLSHRTPGRKGGGGSHPSPTSTGRSVSRAGVAKGGPGNSARLGVVEKCGACKLGKLRSES